MLNEIRKVASTMVREELEEYEKVREQEVSTYSSRTDKVRTRRVVSALEFIIKIHKTILEKLEACEELTNDETNQLMHIVDSYKRFSKK